MSINTINSEETILPLSTAEITNRTESQYNEIFSLGKDLLIGKEILDIGGGLSDFTDKINAKYGSTGTHCRSVDPAYSILSSLGQNANVETFDERVRDNNDRARGKYISFGASDYRDERVPFDIEGSKAALTDRIQEMHDTRKEAAKPLHDEDISAKDKAETVDKLPQIAGSGFNLPFGTETMDLVLSSNFLLYPLRLRKIEGDMALQEAVRVLKIGGELRIFPAPSFYPSKYLYNDETDAPLLVNIDSTRFMPDGSRRFDTDIVTYQTLLELEEKDVHTYFVHTKGAYILILKKGSDIPKDFDGEVKIQKLNFKDTELGSIFLNYEDVVLP